MRVVYSRDTADEFIALEARRLRADGRSVWVSSCDRAIQISASSCGAQAVSGRWLVGELKGERKAMPTVVAEFNSRQQRTQAPATLFDMLDEGSKAAFSTAADAASAEAEERAQRRLAEQRARSAEARAQKERERLERQRAAEEGAG